MKIFHIEPYAKSLRDAQVAGAKMMILAHLGEGRCRFSKMHFDFRERRTHVAMAILETAVAELIAEGVVRSAQGGRLVAETVLELGGPVELVQENPFHES